jgi:hypothetical protein
LLRIAYEFLRCFEWGLCGLMVFGGRRLAVFVQCLKARRKTAARLAWPSSLVWSGLLLHDTRTFKSAYFLVLLNLNCFVLLLCHFSSLHPPPLFSSIELPRETWHRRALGVAGMEALFSLSLIGVPIRVENWRRRGAYQIQSMQCNAMQSN